MNIDSGRLRFRSATRFNRLPYRIGFRENPDYRNQTSSLAIPSAPPALRGAARRFESRVRVATRSSQQAVPYLSNHPITSTLQTGITARIAENRNARR
ncbi:hypothetical protein BGLA2_1680035 [Burkholderia gladioli]|nr:hypothetical protein BGLA2_1680035 [Burkholderia gladioli]